MTKTRALVISGAGALIIVIAVVVAGPWVYDRFVVGDQPEELSLPVTDTDASGARVSLDGDWSVAGESIAGYRVDEVLWGRDVTVVGRTGEVAGSASVSGGVLSDVAVTVDMASVTTDDERRDNQYRNRIMDTATYPDSAFVQTVPVEMPAAENSFTVPVTGELTVRGVTRTVTVDLDVQRNGEAVNVAGALPVVFSDFSIPEPSIAGISVDDNGVIEFLLELQPA
ncbi:YceI family protein [Hoyosella sp. YIM 151337]|uniref:YceI family protein n=1 Tax=Hoyosella sp. YIM 151337 TaxID=2992742 RepID=UPI0022355D8A|nr:YceI family protein [Hoyosella sp. YIM 151337]MCW4354418.1 YceI family protein [Hoyosella sp. YIM 151337]